METMQREMIYPTLVENMPEAEYHARPEISKSQLDKLAKSPRTYQATYITHEESAFKATPAMAFGSLVHLLVLEPSRFDEVAVKPKYDRRRKADKDADDAFMLEHKDCDFICDEATLERARAATKAVHDTPFAVKLLEAARSTELSVFVEDEETGLALRGRADLLLNSGSVADLKTTRDASPRGFNRSIWDYRYDVQGAYYSDLMTRAGIPCERFFFICVESEPPHLTAVYWLSADRLEKGRIQYRENLETLKRCIDTDVWPAFAGGEL